MFIEKGMVNVMDMVMISEHAYKRIKERMGLNRKGANSIVNKAIKKGLDVKSVHGNLKIFLDRQMKHKGTIETIKIYNQHLFLIGTNNVVITVLNLPTKLFKELNKTNNAIKIIKKGC